MRVRSKSLRHRVRGDVEEAVKIELKRAYDFYFAWAK